MAIGMCLGTAVSTACHINVGLGMIDCGYGAGTCHRFRNREAEKGLTAHRPWQRGKTAMRTYRILRQVVKRVRRDLRRHHWFILRDAQHKGLLFSLCRWGHRFESGCDHQNPSSERLRDFFFPHISGELSHIDWPVSTSCQRAEMCYHDYGGRASRKDVIP